MFFYDIYGNKVLSNVEMPLLEKASSVSKADICVNVIYNDIESEDVYIDILDGNIKVKLGKLASYDINLNRNTINCTAKNFEAFFSTFFNIPFSVFFLNKNEVLFHACSLLYGKQIICLTGNKGVGKSTLMSILNKEGDFEIFSDDTLHINSSFWGTRAHKLSKQTTETVKHLELTTLNQKNVAGKFYSNFENSVCTAEIKKILHITRCDTERVEIKKISSPIMRNFIFKSNIVGISYMPASFIAKSLKFSPIKNIDFYELRVPNGLEKLIQHRAVLKELILGTLG